MESDLQSLKETLDNLNDSVSNLSVCLQKHKEQTTAELANLKTSLNTSLSQHQQKTTTELTHLQTSLNSTQSSLAHQTGQLNYKLDTLNTGLSQHQQQTTAEVAHLKTSLNSKLDSLMATAAHLSYDHQEIQTNISDVQCTDTHQRLQNNLTHQQETIKDCIEKLAVHSCGGTGGWRRVVYLDMTDPHTTCPSGWNMTEYSKRSCGRNNTGSRTCDSATFPVSGGEYSRVCGRIKAYQSGPTLGFYSYHTRIVTTIDGAYAGGVSLTHGTPRTHIWTFVAGTTEGNPTWVEVCPCDATSTIRIPPFVGNDYFCESGINERWRSSYYNKFHPNDTLWDGEGCLPSSTCCSQHNPPYFTKQLLTSTTDDIEARICQYNPFPRANIAVELVELYVQ